MLTFWLTIATFSVLALVAGSILGFAGRRFQVTVDPIVEHIDTLLPQIQCAKCGYPSCRSYAEAIAAAAPINKCIPGGETVILKIAEQLGVGIQPMKRTDSESPIYLESCVAWIDEGNCFGCTKCIYACPVDAIVGSLHTLHTVLSDFCTGCHLCLAFCPTNCIKMRQLPITSTSWNWDLNTIPVTVVQKE